MKNTNNITLIIFIIIVVGVILTATFFIYRNNTKKEESQTNEVSENNVAIVDNLKMGISGYDTINPILTKNKEILNLDKLIFEPLINLTSDYQIENNLIEGLTKISDIKYQITLKQGIKWQDGTTLTTADVEFTINKIKENSSSVYNGNVAQIESMDIINDSAMLINLSSKVTFFEYNLTFPIVSSKFYKSEDFDSSTKIPIGTGMFRIASIDDNNILLVKNERWHNKEKTITTKSITVHKYNSVGEIFNDFKMNNIDIVNTHLSNFTEYIGTIGYNKKVYSEREYDFLAFNQNDSVVSNLNVRKAITYGINKELLISNVLNNNKIITKGPLDYGSYLSTDKELLSYDSEKAKKALEDDGYSISKGKYYKDGKALTITILVCQDYTDRVKVAENIKSQLAQVGITVNISSVNSQIYKNAIENKSYQVMLTGILNSINPSLDYFYGANNLANYNNGEVISKIEDLNSYQDIQKIGNQQVIYLPLYRNKGTLLLNANVGGNFSPTSFNIYNNFDKWYRQR